MHAVISNIHQTIQTMTEDNIAIEGIAVANTDVYVNVEIRITQLFHLETDIRLSHKQMDRRTNG